MKNLNVFLKAAGAGLAIGIGGIIFLACESRVLGAFMFAVGLLTVCVFKLNLYTGKVGYILDNKNDPNCIVIWLGNLAGTVVTGLLIRIAKPTLADKAAGLVTAKLGESALQAAILGLFCGFMMYIAVDNFINNQDSFGRYIGIFICVPVFILSGFEHSIANMFYFACGITSTAELLPALVFTLIVTLANGVGAVFLNWIFKKGVNR